MIEESKAVVNRSSFKVQLTLGLKNGFSDFFNKMKQKMTNLLFEGFFFELKAKISKIFFDLFRNQIKRKINQTYFKSKQLILMFMYLFHSSKF